MRSPATHGLDYKDAIFISPHKFIGGPGTPGVLVVRRELLDNPVPAVPGGGTVSYVSGDHHRYVTHPEHREEGGTRRSSSRSGRARLLAQGEGRTDLIRKLEHEWITRAIGPG